MPIEEVAWILVFSRWHRTDHVVFLRVDFHPPESPERRRALRAFFFARRPLYGPSCRQPTKTLLHPPPGSPRPTPRPIKRDERHLGGDEVHPVALIHVPRTTSSRLKSSSFTTLLIINRTCVRVTLALVPSCHNTHMDTYAQDAQDRTSQRASPAGANGGETQSTT